MEVGESGEKRPNFSAISSNNGPLIKLPTNSSSKPSDIRKLVIKNFKGKCWMLCMTKIRIICTIQQTNICWTDDFFNAVLIRIDVV